MLEAKICTTKTALKLRLFTYAVAAPARCLHGHNTLLYSERMSRSYAKNIDKCSDFTGVGIAGFYCVRR
jgi:hypothetical protein